MRPGSVIPAVVTVLVIAGAVYYFYGYRNRDISSDFNAAREYTEDAGRNAAVKSAAASHTPRQPTEDAATPAAVKSALALNKQLASLDIHVSSANNAETKDNNVT